MPAELALAAYRRVRELGLLRSDITAAELEMVLAEPFAFQGRARKYRFARQKAKYLSGCLTKSSDFTPPDDDIEFRNGLKELPGVGLKTASWVVRNLRPDSEVAIIDIHILRAGRYLGLFPSEWEPETHYKQLEERFVGFAHAIGVSAAKLDGLMWDHMRRLSPALRRGQVEQGAQMALFDAEVEAMN